MPFGFIFSGLKGSHGQKHNGAAALRDSSITQVSPRARVPHSHHASPTSTFPHAPREGRRSKGYQYRRAVKILANTMRRTRSQPVQSSMNIRSILAPQPLSLHSSTIALGLSNKALCSPS